MTTEQVRKSIEEQLAKSLYGNPFAIVDISEDSDGMCFVTYTTPAYLPGSNEPEEVTCKEWMMA